MQLERSDWYIGNYNFDALIMACPRCSWPPNEKTIDLNILSYQIHQPLSIVKCVNLCCNHKSTLLNWITYEVNFNNH